MTEEAMRILVTQYGPVAFGLIALLILWRVIVAPTLSKNAVDMGELKAISEVNRETATTLKETVGDLRAMMRDRMQRSPQPPWHPHPEAKG